MHKTTLDDGTPSQSKMKKKFYKVLLSIESHKVFKIEASSEDEAVEILKRRWADGVGGEITINDFETTNVQFDVIRQGGE